MGKFKPGDLCRVVYLEPDSSEAFQRYKNEVVEIVKYDSEGVKFGSLHLKYVVKALIDGEILFCTERELKLIEPPKRDIDKVVSWESVGWKPKELQKA
jgi:hypothetical protein